MAKEKQFVFSARTTEAGLRLLNDLKKERGVSWDDLVIEAVSAHYGLDRAVMSLPSKEKTVKEAPATEQQAPAETAKERTTEKTKRKSKKR